MSGLNRYKELEHALMGMEIPELFEFASATAAEIGTDIGEYVIHGCGSINLSVRRAPCECGATSPCDTLGAAGHCDECGRPLQSFGGDIR